MFRRRDEARDAAVDVANVVAHDAQLRRRIASALEHGAAARRRAARQVGLTGLALRLSTDRELQGHLKKMSADLQSARNRLRRKRSHRVRNTILIVVGAGTAAVAAVPLVRRLRGRVGEPQAASPPSAVATIEEEIEVEVPLSTAYNQWTQFEDFPLFMEGVDDVRQIDDTTLHWVANVAGKRAEWDAKILHQEPDSKITWESLDGRETRGTVRFGEAGPGRTVIRLAMGYRPDGMVETVGSAAGLDRRRVRGDLTRFKELIEAQGVESGAWRGEVKGGRTV